MPKPHKIERLYAWITVDETGEDGVPAFEGTAGEVMPMIGSDKERIESLRPLAMKLATEGYDVRLVEFTGMVLLETVESVGPKRRHVSLNDR